MADPIPAPAARKKPPVDVRARIQQYQPTSGGSEEMPAKQLVKSNSFNDLQKLRTKVDVRDSWLQVSFIENYPSSFSSPPKPAPRKKLQPLELPKQPYMKKSETMQKKLGSTDLTLLPSSSAQSPGRHKNTPPRPPPPSLKPGNRLDKKPLLDKDIPPVSSEPSRTTPTLVQKFSKIDESSSSSNSSTKPMEVPNQTLQPLSPAVKRQSSGTSSSLTDSNEEEPKGISTTCMWIILVMHITITCMVRIAHQVHHAVQQCKYFSFHANAYMYASAMYVYMYIYATAVFTNLPFYVDDYSFELFFPTIQQT